MSTTFAIFAGLGSESIFSDETYRRVVQDALIPECTILLQSCHRTFRAQIADAIEGGIITAGVVNLNDFTDPVTLACPLAHYRQNVLVQHTALYLQQTLRYFAHLRNQESLAGAAGCCVGLLPAAVAATGGLSVLTLISRAYDFFQLALWIGIRSENYRRDQLSDSTGPTSGVAPSCSYVVDGLSQAAATELIDAANLGGRIVVSAVLSQSRVTLSGVPSEVANFVSAKLPAKCRTRRAEVFSLYHNSHLLKGIRDEVLQDLEQCSYLSQTELQFAAPLLSTVTGEPLTFSARPSFGEVASAILDMIFLEMVDWVAVQDSIALLANDNASVPVNILNYGPGLGMSPAACGHTLGTHVTIVDGSKPSKPVSLQPKQSNLSPDDIAIVGMAVDLPGAPDANALWERLIQGANSCMEIPTSRFNFNEYSGVKSDGQGNKKGTRVLNTKYGNFLENPFLFDAELFDISRREARSMDPQQRVLLQTAYRALEDAGYVPDSTPSFSRSTFGCWIGNATLDYVDNLRNEIDVYYSTGTLRTFLSARISYIFGWSGPSITLDTACSSSIVALHQAARSILAGDCRAVLVGAANTITSPDMYLGLDRAHFLSPSGQCKAFDASADGYCRAEGCGVFVIKKLSDALAEGDRIHAVIKAIEINQSGNTHSITHPHVPTQELLFADLFRKADIDPHEVTVVEMHGTGTQAGDPNEVEAVRRVLCKDRDAQNPVHLTSIKANIGHAEAVSGIAGLAKIVLMMRHGRIPPQISLKNLNPRIRELGIDGAVIDREGAEWPRSASRAARIGMLNNFGAGGSNAAVLVSEYPLNAKETPHAALSVTSMVCGFSAKTKRAAAKLQEMLAEYLAAVQKGPSQPSLADVCATLTSRRQLYNYRVAVTAGSLAELAEKTRAAVVRHISDSPSSNPEAVFVFSGQGSQYMGMGRQLMELYGDFAETVNMCDRWLVQNEYPSCLQIILAEGNESTNAEPDATVWQAFQSAMFVLEVALARLLMSWGITPSAVVGHSLGEYAALVTAGVLELFDGLKLVARRASLMMQRCELGQTSMLAVNCNAATAQIMIDANDDFAGLAIACSNSETDCVIGGPVPKLLLLKHYLTESRGLKSKVLDVPLAFHTQAMDPILAEFTEFATREAQVRVPMIPVVSNALRRTVLAGEDAFSPDYFAKQCRSVVSFDESIKDFLTNTEAGASALRWVEIGPHPSVQPMLRGRLRGAGVTQVLLPTMIKNASPADTIARLLCHFYETSVGINWRKVFSHSARTPYKLIDLPGMPFFQGEFHVPYRELAETNTERPMKNALTDVISNSFTARAIQRLSSDAADGCAIYDTPAVLLKEFIEGHLVCGHALCPASVYHEMALSATRDVEPEAGSSAVWSLAEISYLAPFVYEESLPHLLRIVIRPRTTPSEGYDFTILSYLGGSGPEERSTTHCQGIVKRKTKKSVELKYSRLQASISGKVGHFKGTTRQLLDVTRPPSPSQQQVFSRSAMYEKIFTRVVTYSEPYQKVQSIRINDETGEALAACVFPERRLGGSGTIPAANAIFMDMLLHVAGFVANLKLANDLMGICKEVGAATVLRPTADYEVAPKQFDIYCSTFDIKDHRDGSLTIANAYALDSEGVFAVFKGMVFQHVQLTRISKALGLASRSSRKSVAEALLQREGKSIREDLADGVASSLAPGMVKNTSHATSPPQVCVKDLVAQVCGLRPEELTVNSQLDALGVDSLMVIELESELASALGVQLSPGSIASCVTVGDIECLCEASSPGINRKNTGIHNLMSSVSASVASNSEIQTPAPDFVIHGAMNITEIIADLCGTQRGSVSLESELSSLGIDSLLSLELEDSLREIYGSKAVPSVQLQKCRTVGDIESLIEQRHQHHHSGAAQIQSVVASAEVRVKSPSQPRPSLTLLPSEKAMIPAISRLLQLDRQPELVQPDPQQQQSIASPLFLIHDGSGICTHYHRLQPLGRQVFAIHDPKFLLSSEEDQKPWPSLTAMAAHYAGIVSSATEPTRDCLLGGWSFGGVVAFEAARILMSQGYRVKGVILIDSPPPIDHVPLSDSIISAVTASQQGERGHASGVTGNSNNSHNPSSPATTIRKLVQRSFQVCADLIGAFDPIGEAQQAEKTFKRDAPPIALLRSAVGWTPPLGYEGTAVREVRNRWLEDRHDRSIATDGWETLTGRPVQCIDIPGNHFQAFDAVNIEAVSNALRRVSSDFDSGLPQ